MSGTADPWEPAVTPALLRSAVRRPSVERIGAPDRIYDKDAADPNWKPRPAGFTAKIRTPVDPLTWEGDNA